MKDSNFAGYIKLSGSGIQSGLIDLEAASELLSGIDTSLRFFIARENPDYAKVKYELPVKIEKGSLIVYLVGLAGTGVVSVATAYGVAAAQTLAKNDVGEKGSKEVFGSALNKMRTTTTIAKHRRHLGKEKIDKPKFKDNNQVIGIPNSKGEYLYVRRDELDAFMATPPKLYEPLARNVREDIDLTIGVRQADGNIQEETITEDSKSIFVRSEEETPDEVIFPEMVDNMYVELEGELTRGNGRTNTVGFAYKDHILTCEPARGSITRYKQALFGRVIIKGTVRRHYKGSAENDEDKKPRIVFTEIIALGNGTQAELI